MNRSKTSLEETKDAPVKNKQEELESFNKNYTPNSEMEEKLTDRDLYEFTSIDECLTVSIHEYNIERNKKDSFDNRAGLIITVLLAIILAIYNKIPFKIMIANLSSPITFIVLMQTMTTILIYFFLMLALYYSVKIISVKITENFDITIINTEFVRNAKIYSVSKLLEIYLTLTMIHRNKNKTFARQLARSQMFMIISIVLIIINLNLLQ